MIVVAEKASLDEPVRWASLAEPQLCVMEALSIQLARVNQLLEASFNDLSTQFVRMAEDMKTYRALTRSHLDTGGAELAGRIEATLAQSIMSMQFQDRVSQNLVITMDVLKALAAELETQLNSDAQGGAPIQTDAARELYHFLRLGEIRGEYLEALKRRGYIRSVEDLGISGSEIPKEDCDNVELF